VTGVVSAPIHVGASIVRILRLLGVNHDLLADRDEGRSFRLN
jgi:hypothetical protein